MWELRLDGDPAPVKLWDRGAPWNVENESIVQVLFAGDDDRAGSTTAHAHDRSAA